MRSGCPIPRAADALRLGPPHQPGGEESGVCTFAALSDLAADMFTTVYIGNSQTRIFEGKLVTPRGYTL